MDTNENTSSVTDTLKLRNTETSALKRMPSVSATSSASSAARKTIKLKPLSPQLVGGSTDPDPSSMSVAVPLMKMSAPSPAPNTGSTEGASASAPQFMSTATAPVAKIQRPEPATPLTGAASAPKGGTGTVSIPRINLKPKTVVPPPSTEAGAPEKPQGTPAGKTPGEKSVSTASGSIPKYVATSTSSLPKAAAPSPTSGGGAPKYVSTSTSPIPVASAPEKTGTDSPLKSAIDQAKLQSGMQGAKPAIKLRPSANPGGPAAGTTSSSPTIKLTPRTDSTVSPVPPAASSPAAGSASPTMTAKISRKSVTSSPVASAPTVELSSPTIQLETPANTNTGSSAPAPAPAPASAPAPAPAPAPAADTADPGVTTKIPRKLGLKKAESAAPAPAPASAASAPSPAAPSPAAEKKPGAPTLRKQDDIAKVNLTKNEGDGEQALQMGQVEEEPLEKTPVKKKKKVSGEPHMFFAVCVIVAFVVTSFVVYTLVAHYLNTWEGKKLPVVGFEQLDAHLSKK